MSFLDGMNGKNTKSSANAHAVKKSAAGIAAQDTEAAEEQVFHSKGSLSGHSEEKPDTEPNVRIETAHKEDPDFNEEFSEYLMNDVSRFSIQSYSKAGVSFEKLSDTQAKISYDGLLAKSGAQDVFGVYGLGSNQNWEGVSTLTLKKESDGSFIATVPIEQGKNINWAFRDSAENWDNNSGMNYTFVN